MEKDALKNTTVPQQSASGTTHAEPESQLLDAVLQQTVDKIEQYSDKAYSEISACRHQLRRAAMIANAIDRLTVDLDKMKDTFMSLQGTDLGFRHDREAATDGPTEYPWEVVKTVIVEALLKGVRPTMNEINIIAGRLYITQNGYRRKVNEIPGVTDFFVNPGIPDMVNGRTIVSVEMSWVQDGKVRSIIRQFPIRTNRGSNDDNITGKAVRKAYKAAYEYITGAPASDDGDDAHEAIAAAAEASKKIAASKEDVADIRQQMQRMQAAGILTKPKIAEFKEWLTGNFNVQSLDQLTTEQLPKVREWVNALTAQAAMPPDRQPGEEG